MQNYITEIKLKDLPNNEYFSKIPAIKNLQNLQFTKPITFFMGENGSGKSTLLEAIAVNLGFNAEGGSQNFSFSTKDTHSSLHKNLQIVRGVRRPKDSFFLRAESFYNVASYLEEVYEKELHFCYKLDSYGGIPHEKSHGQAFLGLALNRFNQNGLYLLDEPEAALSPQNQLTFMTKIHELAKKMVRSLLLLHTHRL